MLKTSKEAGYLPVSLVDTAPHLENEMNTGRSRLRRLPYVAGALVGLLFFTCWSPLRLFRRDVALPDGLRSFYLDDLNGIPAAGPTLAQQLFDEACADDWIARGELCPALHQQLGLQTRRHIDVVIPWVNGSTPWLAQARAEAYGTRKKHENRYRDHQELIHNIRSIMENVPVDALRRIYFLTADLPAPNNGSFSSYDHRVGQIPTWLNMALEGVFAKDAPELHVIHHSHFIRLRSNDSIEAQDDYREDAVPTFNSNSIEVSLGMIPDLAENILYLNDDMLILRNMSTADMSTPLYGPHFRARPDYRMTGQTKGDSDGEYPGMGHASRLLDARFGNRERSYLGHGARVLSAASLREGSRLWAEEFDQSTLTRFRDAADINGMFIHTHLHVEKHREALLWSMLVARFDSDHDGYYSAAELNALIDWVKHQSMSPDAGIDDQFMRPPRREASQADHIAFALGSAGLKPPQLRPYRMTSFDGYAYINAAKWPEYPPTDHGRAAACTVTISECFNFTEGINSSDVLRKIAFESPKCGDCMLLAGLAASGMNGLEAFLPPKTTTPAHVKAPSFPPLIAPTAKSYQTADYSIATNLANWPQRNLRSFCVRLIQRYQYAMSDGMELLLMIGGHYGLRKRLDQVTMERSVYNSNAFLVLNDDVKMDREVDPTNQVLVRWMDEQWPIKSRWEL